MSKQEVILCEGLANSLTHAIEKCPHDKLFILTDEHTPVSYTHLPLEFFEDEQTEIIFYHNHPKRENETVQYNILHKNSTVVLFGIDKSACSFLREQYPDCLLYTS